jgi:hypothetical protein
MTIARERTRPALTSSPILILTTSHPRSILSMGDRTLHGRAAVVLDPTKTWPRPVAASALVFRKLPARVPRPSIVGARIILGMTHSLSPLASIGRGRRCHDGAERAGRAQNGGFDKRCGEADVETARPIAAVERTIAERRDLTRCGHQPGQLATCDLAQSDPS